VNKRLPVRIACPISLPLYTIGVGHVSAINLAAVPDLQNKKFKVMDMRRNLNILLTTFMMDFYQSIVLLAIIMHHITV